MKEYLLYIAARLASALLSELPIDLALGIGRVCGILSYVINRKRYAVAYANLKAAYGEALTSRERKRIIKGVYITLIQSVIEFMRFPTIDEAYVKKYVTIENKEFIDQALAKKNGVIVLTAHFGNWELSALVGAIVGYRLYIVAREQKLTRLNSLLNKYRELRGSRIIPKGLSIKELFKNLKENRIIAILADQDAGKNGIFVNFFGRLASTPRGAFELAYKLDSVVLPLVIIRTKGPYHKIIIEKPIEPDKALDKELAGKKGFECFASLLERYIRSYPSQWLWLHKRWKSTPDKHVLVLDDGKAGHRNQSMAIVGQIKKAYLDKYKETGTLHIITIKVEFTSKFKRIIFNMLSILCRHFIQGNLGYFRFAFMESTFLKISHTYADIIISCGSSLASLNVALKRENNAKSIVLMKPPFVRLKNFDLAIIPEHDRPPKGPNIISTTVSPNLIDDGYVKEHSVKLINKLTQNKPIKIGVLLGGKSKRGYLGKALIETVLEELKAVSLRLDASLLVTTSRRTPPEIEHLLEKELTVFGNCGILVIANKDNPPETVGGILGLSTVIVLSGDSISMISEAVHTGKPVIVFEINKKKALWRRYKEEILIDKLSRQGLISFIKPAQLAATIDVLVHKQEPLRELTDASAIYNYLISRVL
ncbi:MAG: ELM1/GtrOC1 family putative glycosyltransferase [Candidatus Omnitrophota bacterium]